MSRTRVVSLGLLALGAAMAPAGALARGQLRVRAATEFANLGMARGALGTDVSGMLHDDAGQPVENADVAVTLADGERAAPCRPDGDVRAEGSRAIARTDALGFFCMRLSTTRSLEGAVVSYAGDAYHDRTQASVPRDLGQRRLVLEFEKPRLLASLDEPSLVVHVTTRVVEGTGTGDAVRLVLFHQPSLDAEGETELAATDVPAGATAKFDVETRALGAPGTGKIVARFGGTGTLAPAMAAVPVERRAIARLSLAATPPPSDPNEGVQLTVGVGSVAGAVTSGWVEALVDGKPAGVAPVSAGAAHVVATFAETRGKPVSVVLRYVPSGAGFVAGDLVVVTAPIRPPSPWRGTPWLLAAGAVAYWVVRSWKRPERASRARRNERPAKEVGRASVEVVEADPSRSGWRGRVLDAHEGTPIEAARISILVPVFDGEGVAATQTSAADGSFTIAKVKAARNDGSRLVVTAPYHATLSAPVPKDGILSVGLVSRRRALLERLVSWANRAGGLWVSRRREPTPLEIAELARRRQDENAAEWAAQVAEAAYGPSPPDERREGEIVSREPPLSGLGDER